MKTVKQILQNKGSDVWTIGSGASVFDALALMADKEVGALVVMKGDQVKGLLSERDYARKVILKGRASADTQVKDIMTSRVVCAEPNNSAEECLALMTEKRVRHLPIIQEGKMVGLVSIGDLVKAIIADQKFIIEQLENYISS